MAETIPRKPGCTRRAFLTGMALGASALPGCAGRSPLDLLPLPRAANSPNVVLIMADDMGFSDIGCYGGEIETPNLNRLATFGLRFRNFYNTARCCPTRASLMTGLYPHQSGMGWMTVADLGSYGYHGDLNRDCVTIAEVLKLHGYGTYMAGKWHLTSDKDFDSPADSWPCARGFEQFFGTIAGGGSYFSTGTLTRNNERIKAEEGFYYTDAISGHAAAFIREHDKKRRRDPMFLYVAYTSPHWPLHAKPADIAKYNGRYDEGWDELRAQRHDRMKGMGIIDPKWPLTPRDPEVQAWHTIEPEKQREMARRMEIYAAQVDCMDQGIGRIVDALKETNRFQNTLILFLADNGGCAEGGSWGFGEFDADKIGTDDSWASYGKSWANASNTPFRMYKHWVHEGGISTPLIAHWPARIRDNGAFRDQPGHLIDIMATCVDVCGAAYPDRYKDREIWPMEGKSLAPAFRNLPVTREALYWEHEANRAVRAGNWKLVAKGKEGPWELYDLGADRTEMNDLAAEQPERVKTMADMWQRYAERTRVLPLDGRSWDARIKAAKEEAAES